MPLSVKALRGKTICITVRFVSFGYALYCSLGVINVYLSYLFILAGARFASFGYALYCSLGVVNVYLSYLFILAYSSEHALDLISLVGEYRLP